MADSVSLNIGPYKISQDELYSLAVDAIRNDSNFRIRIGNEAKRVCWIISSSEDLSYEIMLSVYSSSFYIRARTIPPSKTTVESMIDNVTDIARHLDHSCAKYSDSLDVSKKLNTV